VVVTNGDVDNIAGLLNLREKQAFALYGPDAVLAILKHNAIFQVLDPEYVTVRSLEPGSSIEPIAGLRLELFHVAGKPPLYLEADLGIESGHSGFTSGVEVTVGTRRVLIMSSCAHIDAALKRRIQTADVLLFDGTVFEDDEMIQQGLGQKTGRRMGHLPITAANGPLVELADATATRKLFFHINNTNPIWDAESDAYRVITEAGWEVSKDGMVIPL
jgi:pyrroloquinoline quinone biosynthesis protein B